ncbi:MAG: DNA alkylation repair protein [Candidatus Zixiibacteriota bacterium]
MAEALASVYPRFNTEGYIAAAVRERFDTRELKERIKLLAALLQEFLPSDYRKAVDILIAAAPGLPIFENWIFTSYVEQFGLEHFEDSVAAMQELTKHGTGEFAIRPYIVRYPDKMVAVLEQWTSDPNEHVRRLAAEGSRPRGVWTMHIEAFRKDPKPVLKILEHLKADPSLYVRKAVANNLNDISKDYPDILLKTAVRWMKDKNPHTNWILKHACRSLIKKGVPGVFPLFGFTPSVQLGKVTLATSKRRVTIGAEFILTCRLVSKAARPQKLAIDYKIHYVKSNGRTQPKLFKWAEKRLPAGGSLELSTRHSFAERSTRRHFPGKHLVELIVNGRPLARTSFDLVRG